MTGSRGPRHARCDRWDRYISIGPGPEATARDSPGRWIPVYELRPLEFIAYLLGIPFRPVHPPSAIIYNDWRPSGFQVVPACRVAELGHSARIRGESPWSRLLSAGRRADALLHSASQAVTGWLGLASEFLNELAHNLRRPEAAIPAVRHRKVLPFRRAA